MRFKKLMTILLSSGLALPVFSQQPKPPATAGNYEVKGIVTDTSSHVQLKDAAVLILNDQDSVIRQFTRSRPDGSFLIKGMQSGSYLLYVSYPGYADYTERFALDSIHAIKEFSNVPLILKASLLKEVLIKGTVSAIRIKGDTTEYNAGSYHVGPNAKVEDLLKRLPGIQIDQHGTITAQGQKINKVLVDGEEFFGDDPTLVTRNIRADMVDKVQLYDQKSDQAKLTGYNDGKSDRTINLKLKEDKKQGYFGKAEAGAGNDGYYKGQLMFNSFKAKRRFSLYGLTGNDGKTSLNWQDNSKYASSNIDVSAPGMMIDLGGYDELESFSGQYSGRGAPLARTGGAHYDNKWKGDTLNVNANYKIGTLTVEGTGNDQTQNSLPTGLLRSKSDQVFRNSIFRQKIDGVFGIRPDSTSELKVTVNGGIKNSDQASRTFTTTNNGALKLNDNSLSSSSETEQKNLTSGLLYTKKLHKPGRTLSLNLIGAYSRINTSGQLASRLNFYTAGLPDSTQSLDQFKSVLVSNKGINTILNYSEPLSKAMLMMVSYGLAAGESMSDQSTYDQLPGGFRSRNDLYSNNFEIKQLSSQYGLNFNLAKDRTILAFGSKVSAVDFRQLDVRRMDRLKRNFLLWNPQVNLNYRISQQYSFRLNYEGNSTEPTVAQLQPVLINNDPLNITQGNPYLNPSFVQRLFAMYQGHNPLNGQLIGLVMGAQLTTNPVAISQTTDLSGKTISRYLNLDQRNTGFNFAVFYDQKIKPIDLSAGINLTVNGNSSYNLSNEALNRTHYTVYTLQSRFSKAKADRYEFNCSLGPKYTFSGSSLQREINNNGQGFAANGDLMVYLPAKFQLSANADYQYNGKTETFPENFSRLIINVSLHKLFLKEQTLKLSITGSDLLNQNTGFSRNVSGNLIAQSDYTIIRRYFMLSLSYDFNKMGGE